MLYAVLALIAALAVVVLAFASLLRSVQRTNAREHELLVNQLLYVTGSTWQAPPAREPQSAGISSDEWWMQHEPSYVASPEQDPDTLVDSFA